jgi:nucleotide-binding universal stress UspA family protein
LEADEVKILIAVDGSPHSLRAVQGVLEHVSWFRDPPTLTLITVHPPVPTRRAAVWAGKQALDAYYDEGNEEHLREAKKLLDDRGVKYEAVKKVGEIAHEVTSYANAGGFDVIAAGTHGHTNLENLVMGSVATKILASSKVPVLLFK